MTKTHSKKPRTRRTEDLVRWARHAMAGLDDSNTMIGLWRRDEERGEQYWRFGLQIGVCLMEGKPLLLIVPHGTEVPERLKAAASAVEFYVDGNTASVEDAVKRAFEAIGQVVKH